MRQLLIFTLFILLPALAFSQEQDSEEVVQFSGVVVTGDSLLPVAYTTVALKSTNRGTMTDDYGFFTLPAFKGDTIRFSGVGYKAVEYTIPDTLESKRYSVVQVLRKDTVQIPTTFVYPWPTPEQFKEEFLALELYEDEVERARKNLDPEEMYSDMMEMGMDSQEAYRYTMRKRREDFQYAGQAPPIQVLNPIAWAKFIRAWRDGDFKRDD
ncbi:carboxypeptidase-like regulatory domain-containing protein [Halocola ammonii]